MSTPTKPKEKAPKKVRNMQVGYILRTEREIRSMSGDAFGQIFDRKYPTLSQYESGERPFPEECRKLLFAFLKDNPPTSKRGWPPFTDERLLDPNAV